MKKRPAKWPLVAAAAIVIVLTALAAILPVHDWADAFEDRVESMDLVAGLFVFAAVYVGATLLLVPAWIFPLAAGALFGLGWGTVATLACTAASSATAFAIARYVLRGPAERIAKRHRMFKAFDKAVDQQGWRIVALMRVSPLLSFGIKNYFFGLTCVGLPAYLAGTMAGTLPGLLVKVWLGAAGRDVLTRGGPLQWTMLVAGIVATVAASVIVTRVTRERLKVAR